MEKCISYHFELTIKRKEKNLRTLNMIDFEVGDIDSQLQFKM